MEVELVRELPFPADRVWAVFADFGNMGWTGANKWEVEGEGPGMTRRVLMEGLDPIEEVLEFMDHERMRLGYEIPSGIPMPVTDYHATVQVEPLGAQHARVTWGCHCRPTDPEIQVDTVADIVRSTYDQMLDGLAAELDRDS